MRPDLRITRRGLNPPTLILSSNKQRNRFVNPNLFRIHKYFVAEVQKSLCGVKNQINSRPGAEPLHLAYLHLHDAFIEKRRRYSPLPFPHSPLPFLCLFFPFSSFPLPFSCLSLAFSLLFFDFSSLTFAFSFDASAQLNFVADP